MMGRKPQSTASLIYSEGSFTTKPFNIANYFNKYLIGKVGKLRHEMPTTKSEQLYSCITKTNNERKTLHI